MSSGIISNGQTYLKFKISSHLVYILYPTWWSSICWKNEGKIQYRINPSKAKTWKYLKELGLSLIFKSIGLVINRELLFFLHLIMHIFNILLKVWRCLVQIRCLLDLLSHAFKQLQKTIQGQNVYQRRHMDFIGSDQWNRKITITERVQPVK